MRVALLAFVAACSGAAHRPLNPAATRSITVTDDLVVRGEADGFMSVMARATLDGVTAYGIVLLRPTSDAARSPHVVVARARAWHALSIMRGTDEAAARGVALLPVCGRDAATARETLHARLRCYTKQHRLPSSDEVIAIDPTRRMVLRREADAVVVIASAIFEDTDAAGHARVSGVPFENVATSTYATLAYGRAWQMIVRALDADPDRAYHAARSGIQSMDCRDDHWRSRLLRAERIYEDKGVLAARDFLRSVLDQQLEGCVRKYERRSHYPKMNGRRAW